MTVTRFYGAQQDRLHLDADIERIITELGQLSNNLYNECTYAYRQYYFESNRSLNKLLSRTDIRKYIKDSENAALLHSQAVQQTEDSVLEAFKSYKQLHKLYKRGELNFEPKLPKYRTKGGVYQVAYPGQAIRSKDGFYIVPLGFGGHRHFKRKNFKIPIPERLRNIKLRELRFIPKAGQWFVEYVYINPEPKASVKSQTHDHVLGIDIGIDNALTCVSNRGQGFIICGRKVKSINQQWNKAKAKLQSLLPQKQYTSKRINLITLKRNQRMRDWVNKTARELINYCRIQGIDTVIVGHNKMQKQNLNLGKVTNQKFASIPHYKLRASISQLCELAGIHYLETEESYTSKASFLDRDVLPTFGEKPERWQSSGTRVKRGLFRTAQNHLINADCNGAANIMRKVSTKLGLDLSGVSRGALTAPKRYTMHGQYNCHGLAVIV